ncbi:MAG TPA: hypothetical protein VKF81_04765, partial [Blastocatellia bacterium]|nr:hypothetical protein [Blastocatellia bacterium]
CLVINTAADKVEESDPRGIAANPEIGRLLDECKQVGGAFDVLFNCSNQVGVIEASPQHSAPLAPEQPSEVPTSSANVVVAQGELGPGADTAAMTEVKRLMGEIAGTIEEAARAVGPHESFAMSLRAAQLQIADRYAFLDPFAGEFEYLGGEIVLVGQLTIEELIVGLGDALSLTVAELARSTAYAERFRAYVSEDLRRLLASKRAEFERFSLDQLIEHLIEVVTAVEPVRESALTEPATKQ